MPGLHKDEKMKKKTETRCFPKNCFQEQSCVLNDVGKHQKFWFCFSFDEHHIKRLRCFKNIQLAILFRDFMSSTISRFDIINL